MSDFMWDWSSQPTMLPPKDWKLQHQNSKSTSGSCNYKDPKSQCGYSKKVVYSMMITNILSLVIGVGIGVWIYRKSGDQNFKIFL